MKKILVAIDSFKGTLSSKEISELVKEYFPLRQAQYTLVPISDGGEGFVEAISYLSKSKEKEVFVQNAFGDKCKSKYIIINQDTAVMEIALSSGLAMIDEELLNPYRTSSYGLGETIIDALDQGVKKIVIGLGGSSSNDGGAGMLKALGVKFYNQNHEEITHLTGLSIGEVYELDITFLDSRLKSLEINAACDVTNCLLGKSGSAEVYSRQKGASEAMVKVLEKNMKKFSDLMVKTLGKDERELNGSGAAGGLGFALQSVLNAKIFSGFDILAEMTDLKTKIKTADLIITGEGKFDMQSYQGKVPVKIAKLAKSFDKEVIGIFAQCDEKIASNIFDKVYSIVPKYTTAEESLTKPKEIFIEFLKKLHFID
jgi:glycerate kinase